MSEGSKLRGWSVLSIAAVLISLFSLYVNWQTSVVNNRPYIKISPIKVDASGAWYSLEKTSPNEYILSYKFRIENLGKIPANNINVIGEFQAVFGSISTHKMKDKGVKQVLEDKMKDGQYIPYDEDMLEEFSNEPEMKKLIEEMSAKDFDIKKIPRSWKNLSLLPGESFEYIQEARISGKDAEWVASHMNKEKSFRIKLDVTYDGILPKIGKSYCSYAFFVYENREIKLFESKSL